MMTVNLQSFIEFARRDAALQERVFHALKGASPVAALQSVAREAGFELSTSELAESLVTTLDDRELDAVVGGSSPLEWFAEAINRSPKKIEGH